MLTDQQLQAIQAPFPPEALSPDTSRGFELTSIKAAYVFERLNQVFGPCGIGWRYVHSPFEEVQSHDGRVEILTEVALQYRFKATNDCTGCDKVVWETQTGDWAFCASNHDWSEPICACGGRSLGKGSVAFTDARKSAVTDGLTKAASLLGIGHDVFKGLVRVGRDNGREPSAAATGRDDGRTDNGRQRPPDSTAFWSLYHAGGKAAGIALDVAQGLARKGDWPTACQELATLINGAKG